jgi:hypothetical protein
VLNNCPPQPGGKTKWYEHIIDVNPPKELNTRQQPAIKRRLPEANSMNRNRPNSQSKRTRCSAANKKASATSEVAIEGTPSAAVEKVSEKVKMETYWDKSEAKLLFGEVVAKEDK